MGKLLTAAEQVLGSISTAAIGAVNINFFFSAADAERSAEDILLVKYYEQGPLRQD